MTKKWDEHKATIISFYKEQHKPLHEVKRLMIEQHGFEASYVLSPTMTPKLRV